MIKQYYVYVAINERLIFDKVIGIYMLIYFPLILHINRQSV